MNINRLTGNVLAVLLLSCGAPHVTLAADILALKPRVAMPTKAPAYPYATSGCYFGLNTEAGVASTDTSTSSLFIGSAISGKLYAAGGAVGVSGGCIWGNPSLWYGVHGDVDWQNISASAPIAGVNNSVASRFQGGAEVRVGGSQFLTLLTSWLPGGTFPVIGTPAVPGSFTLAATPPLPYVAAGFEVYQVQASLADLSGTATEIAPKLRAGVVQQLSDSNGNLTGAVLDTYAKVVFAGRGESYGNGVLTASTNLGTQYRAGVAVYW